MKTPYFPFIVKLHTKQNMLVLSFSVPGYSPMLYILTISTRARSKTRWLTISAPLSTGGGYSVMRAYVPAPRRFER